MRARAAGFTLVEVAVAIAILGAGLATLISLQTRMTDNFVRERSLFRATLFAQYLIGFLEIEPEPPEAGTNTGELNDALQKNGFFDELNNAAEVQEQIHGWTVEQRVTSVDYADFTDILRRVELTVHWDSSPRDQVSLVLFLKTPVKQNTGNTP